MRYEDFDETRVMNEPFSLSFFRMAETLRTTLALGITTARDAMGADAGLKMAVEQGVLPGPRMQISVSMLSMTGGHNDLWLPSGAVGIWGTEYPGMPSGVCDGVDGVIRKVREMIRAGADVIDRVVGRLPLARRRPAGAELLAGGGRRDRPDGRRPRDVGDVARPRRGGHQARGPGGRPLDRPRDVPGRGRRGDDGRTRDLARPHAHRR